MPYKICGVCVCVFVRAVCVCVCAISVSLCLSVSWPCFPMTFAIFGPPSCQVTRTSLPWPKPPAGKRCHPGPLTSTHRLRVHVTAVLPLAPLDTVPAGPAALSSSPCSHRCPAARSCVFRGHGEPSRGAAERLGLSKATPDPNRPNGRFFPKNHGVSQLETVRGRPAGGCSAHSSHPFTSDLRRRKGRESRDPPAPKRARSASAQHPAEGAGCGEWILKQMFLYSVDCRLCRL